MSDRGRNRGGLPVLYIAAPLFSSAERRFNIDLADRLRETFRVFLPQRDGRLLTELTREGMTPTDAARYVFTADMKAIRDCTVLVAVLDGRSIDEGVAFEIGVAYSLDKKCVGLQTDVRRLLPIGNNPMIDCALGAVLPTVDALVEWLSAYVDQETSADKAAAGPLTKT
jgi:nucleoside 2-deoxyribosyltransferase